MAWGVADAWDAATAVCAEAYGVEVVVIRVRTEGKGFRPPASARTAKKRALWLTAVLTGCEYAEIARVIGMHRDTVASHCADVRRMDSDDRCELSGAALEAMARGRLELMSLGLFLADNPASHRREALRQKLLKLSRDLTRAANSLAPPSGKDVINPTISPTDEEAELSDYATVSPTNNPTALSAGWNLSRRAA